MSAPAPSRAAMPSRRVLLVDDDPANRKLGDALLKLAGYEPTVVASVEDALREARRAPPDVILADVLMPGLDGFQLCLAVRRDPALAAVPVVLVSSAYTDAKDRTLALQLGASDLVPRTPGLAEAMAAIEAAFAPEVRTPSPASGIDQQYHASLRRQLDRQMVLAEETAGRGAIQAVALSMIGALAQALPDPRDVAGALGDMLVQSLDAAGLATGILYLRASDGGMRLHSMAGLPNVPRPHVESVFGHPELLEPGDGALPRAFNRAVPNNAAEQALLSEMKRRSAMIVPFVFLGRHYGTLVLASDTHDLADDTWRNFSRALAAQFGQAMAFGKAVSDLAESDALLRSTVDLSPNGLVMTDSSGRIVMVNRQIERIFGYAAGELVGQSVERLLPARHRAAHVVHRADFQAEPRPRLMGAGRDLVGLHKDGREIPIEVGLASVKTGADVFVMASVVDITVRRQAEDRVRWLSLAVEQGPTSMVMTDVAGDIEYVNPKFTEVTGYTLDEVRGKNPRLLQSGATAPEVYRDLWTTITAGRSWHGEVLNRKKDGSTYWDAMWVYPIHDSSGAVTRFLALKEDVTERKHAEEALRENERRARTLFETVNLVVLGLDAGGKVDYINPFFLHLTGYERSEVLGEPWLRFFPESQRATMQQAFHELLEQGRHAHYEAPVVTKAGKERLIAWNNTVLRDREGRPAGTLSIGEDITEHAQLEAQLRQAQKMEAVGRLAGGVAHDFNNVLTAIFGYVEMVIEDLPATSPSRQDLQEVVKAASRAATLTRQLLAFSRQQILQPRVLSVSDVVQDLEKMLRRVIGEDVTFRIVLAPDLGNVRADASQLEQVLMNLVVNARDAMPTGGKLSIETKNVELTEEYADQHVPVVPGAYVMLAVSDTGIGMSPEVQARVFEPFFTTKEKGKGTGLGLSTVYGIVKQSGGNVWVYSEQGRGTTFKIYLPRVDAAVETVGRSDLVRPLGGTETILVAEDDDVLRPLVRALLTKLGYTVLAAANADAALAHARAHQGPIHLLLSDVVMPGASGRELARHLAESRPDAKVLYVSGYTDDAIVHHGMLEPGLNYLQKPFTPDALARKVRGVLDAE